MTSASGGRHTTTLTWRLWSRRRAYPIPFQKRAVARFARYVYFLGRSSGISFTGGLSGRDFGGNHRVNQLNEVDARCPADCSQPRWIAHQLTAGVM